MVTMNCVLVSNFYCHPTKTEPAIKLVRFKMSYFLTYCVQGPFFWWTAQEVDENESVKEKVLFIS